MKNLLFTLLALVFVSCQTHPSSQPHKHKVYVPEANETFYVTSELEQKGSCITFTCVDNNDFEGTEKKTVCGTFIIEY